MFQRKGEENTRVGENGTLRLSKDGGNLDGKGPKVRTLKGRERAQEQRRGERKKEHVNKSACRNDGEGQQHEREGGKT